MTPAPTDTDLTPLTALRLAACGLIYLSVVGVSLAAHAALGVYDVMTGRREGKAA